MHHGPTIGICRIWSTPLHLICCRAHCNKSKSNQDRWKYHFRYRNQKFGFWGLLLYIVGLLYDFAGSACRDFLFAVLLDLGWRLPGFRVLQGILVWAISNDICIPSFPTVTFPSDAFRDWFDLMCCDVVNIFSKYFYIIRTFTRTLESFFRGAFTFLGGGMLISFCILGITASPAHVRWMSTDMVIVLLVSGVFSVFSPL